MRSPRRPLARSASESHRDLVPKGAGFVASTGAVVLFALVVSIGIAACGGGGSSSSSSAAWSLPNVNVQNTRAIESEITPENVTTLGPAWAVTLPSASIFVGGFAANPVFSPDGKTAYLQDLANDVFAVGVESGEIDWEYDVPSTATIQLGPNGVTYYEGNLYGETRTSPKEPARASTSSRRPTKGRSSSQPRAS
jgi:hypothetical protein